MNFWIDGKKASLKQVVETADVIFMDEGELIEQNEPQEFFNNPQNDRTKLFLSHIL